MKALLTALVLVSTQGMAADVNKMTCFHDMRPVDGNLEQLTLTRQDNGKYEAVHLVVTAGFGSPVSHRETKIASNLTCQFATQDARIASCHKSSSEEGETQNSGVQFDRNSNESLAFDGNILVSKYFNITAYSPVLKETLKMEVPIRTGFGIPSDCKVE